MTVIVERSLILVKPDGVQRCLVGAVISRLEQRGLKIVGLKMVKPSLDHIDNHYPKDEKWLEGLGNNSFTTYAELGMDPMEVLGTKDKKKAGKIIRKWLINYMTEAPIVAMVVEGAHCIDMVRKIVGTTIPFKSPIGTIRGDFSVDSAAYANIGNRPIKNIIHASANPEEADNEIKHWFSEEEIHEWIRPDHVTMF